MKKTVIWLSVLSVVCLCAVFFTSAVHKLKVYLNPPVICLQPFSDIAPAQAEYVYKELKKRIPNLRITDPVMLPPSAWYAPRSRYRADTIIRMLAAKAGDSLVYIGMTTKDISSGKGNKADWGVMGLCYQPGSACVVSTFRLDKRNLNEQLYKLCLHELGHTMGLPHCPVLTCYMRDAEGGNHKDEETGFCASCAARLKKKGLSL